jgi:formylglycine-generating enzyme required for sulfatase activity
MANCTAKGFRLPTSNEYEYAARYIGRTNGGITEAITYDAQTRPTLTTGYYWTPGNYASGATTYFDDTTGVPSYAGKLANDAVAVYGYYWNGSDWAATGVSTTAVVASKTANALGLYDMSGNACGWCFDWYTNGSNRVMRGGGFSSFSYVMQVGYVDGNLPYDAVINIGFRFSRTK